MNQNNNRVAQFVLGLLMLGIGMSMFGSSGLVFLLGMLLFIFGVWRIYALTQGQSTRDMVNQRLGFFLSEAERESRRRARRSRSRRQRPSTNQNYSLPQAIPPAARTGGTTPPAKAQRREHSVAQQAMLRAGRDPLAMPVKPIDLGVMAYQDRDRINVHRLEKVPDSAEYLRPFTVIHSTQRARGKVRFELLDEHGTRHFVDESVWELNKGDTFIYSQTWLPLRNVPSTSGNWTLRIYGEHILLAEHAFQWQYTGGGDFRAMLSGDGEIQNEVKQELAARRLERLSLDDLLAEQDGGVIEFDPEIAEAEREAQHKMRQRQTRR